MIQLLKFIDGPRDKARKFLKMDLDTIQAALNQRWAATFGNNNVLPPSAGGTGTSLGSGVVGDLLSAATATTFTRVPDIAVGNALLSEGVGVIPAYGKVNLTTTVTGILPAINGGTGKAVYAVGDLLTADTTTTLARLADVAVNSVLISKGVGVVPAWADAFSIGTASSAAVQINGRLALTRTQADDAVFAMSIGATFASVITADRVAINYDVTSAGSSAHNQTGVIYTLEPGYTGSAHTYAITVKNGVINPNNQAVGLNAVCLAAGLSNCALSGVSQNATNGNIGVYGGIGGFTEGNFNFNITAAILASNGATTNDIYRGYSSTNLRFSVTDAGNVIAVGSLAGTSYSHSGAEIDKTYQIYTPATLATVAMSAGQSRAIINPAGTIAVLTVTLPPSPVDGQVAGISFTQIVSALTVNAPGGATVVGPPSASAVNSAFRFLYQASSTSWFPAA